MDGRVIGIYRINNQQHAMYNSITTSISSNTTRSIRTRTSTSTMALLLAHTCTLSVFSNGSNVKIHHSI